MTIKNMYHKNGGGWAMEKDLQQKQPGRIAEWVFLTSNPLPPSIPLYTTAALATISSKVDEVKKILNHLDKDKAEPQLHANEEVALLMEISSCSSSPLKIFCNGS